MKNNARSSIKNAKLATLARLFIFCHPALIVQPVIIVTPINMLTVCQYRDSDKKTLGDIRIAVALVEVCRH